jgi:NADPH:quinone reductase-like Zn-dependent oxidoreductase
MQAIVYHRYGSPDVLEFADIDKPVPTADQVLIQVHAASVNPYDWHFLRGTPSFIRLFTGLRGPKFPRLGADVSGIVVAVGTDVTRLKLGDAVFGVCKGAFAEYACASQGDLAPQPQGLSFQQTASVPLAGITALQGLRDSGKVQSGLSVLINGAAGGVGTFAVQIAKSFGAQVTGVCSTRNIELINSIGADQVIDYTREDFTRAGKQYDVIFDLVGNHALAAIRRALRPKGIFVGCGGGGPDKSSGELLAGMFGRLVVSPFTSQKLTGVFAKVNADDLDTLGGLLQSGQIKPVLDRSYPLGNVADAIRYVESCHARGKVTISVA